MSTTTDLNVLKINYLSQAQYDEALENDQIDDNELYLTPAPSPSAVPTADTIAKFDSTAHMNSTNMTSSEVTNFVNGLNVNPDSPPSDTPIANTIAKFDSSAHMNSEDMSAQEVSDFVDSLTVSGNNVKAWTPSITSSTGTLNTATGYKWGSVYMLRINVQNSSAVGNGSNIFVGTLSNHIPVLQITGSGFYSGIAFTASISDTGTITVRNVGNASLAANLAVTTCIIYISGE